MFLNFKNFIAKWKMAKKYKIIQKRELCIGCGACVSVCSGNWEMKSDSKASPKKTSIEEKDLKCNKEAADICPVKCIELKKA